MITIIASILVGVAVAWALAYFSAPGWLWAGAFGVGIAMLAAESALHGVAMVGVITAFLIIATLLNVVPLRSLGTSLVNLPT